MEEIISLDSLAPHRIANVATIAPSDAALEDKLREIGFAEGDEVEVLYYGPLGKRPICVRLNHTMIALRTSEAAVISVKPQALS